jgi:O-acetyl-ADP-ribose deacetylase (regulator of RNase III)
MSGPKRDRIRIIAGDITTLAVDAIVNAANSSLQGGGGVDGAIHRAAGRQLLEECVRVGRCPTGQSRLTAGYRLPARHVIHTVGPVWNGGKNGEDALLASCYRTALALARDHDLDSVAFPAISCGVYRFPLERATRIALGETLGHLERHERPVTVTFVCFSPEASAVYERVFAELAP